MVSQSVAQRSNQIGRRTALAIYLPARRAAKIDPIAALWCE
jgi:hypothetical protein